MRKYSKLFSVDKLTSLLSTIITAITKNKLFQFKYSSNKAIICPLFVLVETSFEELVGHRFHTFFLCFLYLFEFHLNLSRIVLIQTYFFAIVAFWFAQYSTAH